MIGTTLAHYRIEAETGSGGMGVVYRAVDINLKRPVAIKILHAGAIADPDRRRRFMQEAQAASALNHPDIVTIYQIGTEGDTDFIAMEYVAGRSLADVIAGRPLPLADVVKFGSRIAGALAAAHHAGIVHRDLKPANVMVTDRGGIKLLDFGVAKLLEPSTAETSVSPDQSQTRTGMVVGTLAYMSPEQARGEKVDARSDIYAFGLLLHEMITGRRADPAAPAPIENAPRDLRRIVARCLQQDPDRRFQVIDDAKLALEEAELSETSVSPAVRQRGRQVPAKAIASAAVLLALAGAAWLGWRLKPVPSVRQLTMTRLTLDSGLTLQPVLSLDGRFIAFASDRAGDGNLDIWVRQVAGGEPVRLTNDKADDLDPSFSPDGSSVAFRSDRDGGGIYVISTLGGDARRIADQGRRPRWSPDGTQIAYWTGLDTAFLMSRVDAPRLFVIPAQGGEPRRLFADFAIASHPVWSADGQRLLFLGSREAGTRGADWWIGRADGTLPEATGAYAAARMVANLETIDGRFVPDAWDSRGRVLFSAQQGDAENIWAMPITPAGRADRPSKLTSGTARESAASVDTAGTLAFAAIDTNIDLWTLPLDPATGVAAGTGTRLTQDPAMDVFPWLSPDGRYLTFGSNRSGTFDVWVRDLSTNKDTVVAPRYTFPSLPTFTHDGRITFHSQPRWRWLSLPFGAAAARSTQPQLVCDNCQSFWDLSSDGQWAVYGTDGDTRMMVRNTATGASSELFHGSDEIVGRSRLSPDDRWMAFNDRKSGAMAIYIAPFAGASPIARDRWIRITPEGATVNAATWSADGHVLYYLSDQDGGFCVWGQHLDAATKHPVGEPFPLWHFHEARRSMVRIPIGLRALTVSRDRAVVSIAESAGNIWMAK